MKVVLFDIDGTLADINHRRVFLAEDKPNWKLFNSKMGNDTPNHPVVSLYNTLWNAGVFELILVSGRNQEYRQITEQWLVWNEIPFDRLLMRNTGDTRADFLVKQDILNLLISEGKQIEFVVDDRQQVVDMWRQNGITCFQCDEGNF